jgi:hypothetical protein
VVWIRPGSRWTGTPSVWVGETIEVQVPGEAALVTLRRGGALHLIVTDGDGAPLEATCDVTGPGGAQVETQLEYDPDLGRTWVQPVLPPGEYVLTIGAEGYRRAVRHVTIGAGRPTQVQLALD